MSTRSPMNKRSQDKMRGETSTGVSRRSASSCKPAREAAGSVRVAASTSKERRAELDRGEDLSSLTKEEKKARKRELRMQEDRVYTALNVMLKEDFKYNRFRRVWWFLLGLGVVALVATWGLLIVVNKNGQPAGMNVPEMVCTVVAYAAIIGALVFDFIKIRPLRNMYRAKAEGMSERQLDEVISRSGMTSEEERASAKKRLAAEEAAAAEAEAAKTVSRRHNRKKRKK